ncbi:MAG: hypothetical protein GF364_07285 [Candidatus Lokiarchaeota archaeon]|nr:hypothetical protein [Candidatus Lokiarchaeota archaeon]
MLKKKENQTLLLYDDPKEWDQEWALDWMHLKTIFRKIEDLNDSFTTSNVPYLLEIAQKQIILNLERYLGLLSNMIIEKYK